MRPRPFHVVAALVALIAAALFLHDPLGPGVAAQPENPVSMLTNVAPVNWNGSESGQRQDYQAPSDGSISGVRFASVSSGPDRYLVSLWSHGGALAAWGVTEKQAATGELVATFPTPAAVTKGGSYRVMYWASPRSKTGTTAAPKVIFTPTTAKAPATTPPPVVAPPVATSPSPSSTPSGAPSSTTGSNAGVGSGSGCAASPHTCGYPDATNTGVPAGVKLRASSSVAADKDGQVIDGLDITGEINVTASNVVVKNTRVTGGGDWVVIVRPGANNLTIEDSELMTPAGTPQDIACVLNIGDSLPKILRADIHGCSAGVSSGGGTVQDSYIHDMSMKPGSHDVGVASNGGGGLSVIHNTIFNQFDQTAAVSLYQDFGNQSNDLVQGNLLAGGGYCVYGGNGSQGATSQIRFLNNRFSRKFSQSCGSYGVAADFNSGGAGNQWSGNVWDDTLKAVEN